MRKCSRCGIEKPLTAFCKNKCMPLGRGYLCTPCHREYTRERSSKNKNRVSRYKKSPRARRLAIRIARDYRKKYPERIRATNRLNNAVHAGTITREPCVSCGDKKTDAHHHDYSKPLEVTWLCRRCHKREHSAHSTI